MNTTEYCREISSWIDPIEINRAYSAYSKNMGDATTENGFYLFSDVLNKAEEGNFKTLIEKYIHNFSIPSELITLANLGDQIKTGALKWFRNIKFDGEVVWDPTSNPHPDPKMNVLAFIKERDVVIDIIITPLMMLSSLISQFASTWSGLPKELKQNVFLKHSHHSPFPVYIESEVAKYYVGNSLTEAGIKNGKTNFISIYRAILLGGNDTYESIDFIAGQELSASHAKNTLSTIKY